MRTLRPCCVKYFTTTCNYTIDTVFNYLIKLKRNLLIEPILISEHPLLCRFLEVKPTKGDDG